MAHTNRREQALQLLQKQIDAHPDDVFWRLAYGAGAYQWGAFSQAEPALKAVVEKQPDNQAAHKYLAGVYYQTHRYDLAEKSFQRAAELAPGDPAPQLFLGLILEKKGQAVQRPKTQRPNL